MEEEVNEMTNVLLWRGGVKFFSRYPGAVFDPISGEWLTAAPVLKRPIRIVDVDAYSYATVHIAVQKLERAGYEVSEVLTLPYRPPDPVPAPLVILSGHSCTGKSAIAHQLFTQNNALYFKWSKFIGDEAGRYGEVAFEKECIEPLRYALRAFEALKTVSPFQAIVLDGVKDIRVMYFLGYALARPIIPLFFRTDEAIRKACVQMRRDADDVYDERRRELFDERLRQMEDRSVCVDLAKNDHRVARSLLSKNGLNIRLPVGNTILSKYYPLDILAHASRKPKDGAKPLLRPFHFRYSERFGLTGDTAEIVNLVASAFRVVDDILDEDETRRIVIRGREHRIPALWTEIGVWPAIYFAGEAISYVASRVPDARAFAEMVRRVTDAVRIELIADEEGRRLTRNEYIATFEKETAFRAWVASLSGTDVKDAVRDAIHAQLKNDRYATGRERARLPEDFDTVAEFFAKELKGADWECYRILKR